MILNAGFDIGKNSNVREHTLIYQGVKIGDNFSSGHFCVIRSHTSIGDNCSVGTHTEIGAHVQIGDNVRIHSGCFIPEYTEIESNCWLGPRVTICNCFHPTCARAKSCLKNTRVIIKKGTVVGAGAIIMPGVVLAEDSLIGAGSLITKSTVTKAVYVGSCLEMIYSDREAICCKFDREHLPYKK